jgi:hypothetical protein
MPVNTNTDSANTINGTSTVLRMACSFASGYGFYGALTHLMSIPWWWILLSGIFHFLSP